MLQFYITTTPCVDIDHLNANVENYFTLYDEFHIGPKSEEKYTHLSKR